MVSRVTMTTTNGLSVETWFFVRSLLCLNVREQYPSFSLCTRAGRFCLLFRSQDRAWRRPSRNILFFFRVGFLDLDSDQTDMVRFHSRSCFHDDLALETKRERDLKVQGKRDRFVPFAARATRAVSVSVHAHAPSVANNAGNESPYLLPPQPQSRFSQFWLLHLGQSQVKTRTHAQSSSFTIGSSRWRPQQGGRLQLLHSQRSK